MRNPANSMNQPRHLGPAQILPPQKDFRQPLVAREYQHAISLLDEEAARVEECVTQHSVATRKQWAPCQLRGLGATTPGGYRSVRGCSRRSVCTWVDRWRGEGGSLKPQPVSIRKCRSKNGISHIYVHTVYENTALSYEPYMCISFVYFKFPQRTRWEAPAAGRMTGGGSFSLWWGAPQRWRCWRPSSPRVLLLSCSSGGCVVGEEPSPWRRKKSRGLPRSCGV